MSGLLPYAKELARNPPLTVWQSNTSAISWRKGHQIGLAIKDKDSALHIASKQESKTICDLTAYAIMVVGAGHRRVDALRSRKPDSGDSTEQFRRGSTGIRASLEAWADASGSGVCQLKFDPGGAWHTLTLERIAAGDAVLGYRVYQSYQGRYTFEDFLGLSTPQLETYVAQVRDANTGWFLSLDPSHRPDSEPTNAAEYGVVSRTGRPVSLELAQKRWGRANLKVQSLARQWLDAVIAGRNKVGLGKMLSRELLLNDVIAPFAKLVTGGVDTVPAINLTGHHEKSSTSCDKGVIVMRCDRIDPSNFKSNKIAMRQSDGRGWIEWRD